jgi:hypothetical protein
VAFESELQRAVAPAAVGGRRLLVLRRPEGPLVADALCPHRGADLGYGGRLDGDAVLCPFHGFRIGIGGAGEHGLRVRAHPTLALGGLVLARLEDGPDHGFEGVLRALAAERMLVAGFTLRLRAAADMVIENAFDQAHFRPVHGIGLDGVFRLLRSDAGELGVEGSFDLPPSPWQRGGTADGRVPFRARAFSPGLVVSDLGGQHPYTVITAATPLPEGGCAIRLSLALPRDAEGCPPRPDLVDFLLRRSREGLEKDRAVWEHRAEDRPPRYVALDGPVQAFRDFCAGFIA